MMDQEILKTLFSKGHISKDTYDKGIKKFADGGQAVSNVPEYLQPNSAYAPVSESSASEAPVAPDVQAAANKAIENTAIQAQKIVPSNIVDQTISGLPSKIANAPEATKDQNDQYYKVLQAVGPEKTKELVDAGKIKAPPSFVQSNIIEPLQAIREKNIAAQNEKLKALGIQTEEPQQAQKDMVPTSNQQAMPTEKPEFSPFQAMMSARQQQAGAFEKALGMKAGALQQEAAAAAKLAAVQTSAMTTSLSEMKDYQQKMAAAEAERQASLKDAENSMKQSVEDFNKAAVIDPNRYWANKTTGQKIGAAIAIFLGGVGGGRNEVYEHIENAINRDIDAQKAQISSKKMGIELSQNVYKNLLDKFQDQRAAEKGAYLVGLNMVELQLKKAELATQNPAIQAKLQSGLADLQMKKAELQGQFIQAMSSSLPMMAASQTAQKIQFNVPDEFKKEAMAELGEYKKHEAVIDNLKQSMKDIYNNRLALPGSDGAQVKEAAESNIKTLTSELFGGKSEQEFKIVQGFFPNKYSDSDKTYQYKTDQLLNKFRSQKAFPVLQEYNVIPKQLTGLKRN